MTPPRTPPPASLLPGGPLAATPRRGCDWAPPGCAPAAGAESHTEAAGDPEALGGPAPDPGLERLGEGGGGGREYVVPKTRYCQSCPHFGDPPALSCTHEGTDIVAVVDGERFRVRNCPMVDD